MQIFRGKQTRRTKRTASPVQFNLKLKKLKLSQSCANVKLNNIVIVINIRVNCVIILMCNWTRMLYCNQFKAIFFQLTKENYGKE